MELGSGYTMDLRSWEINYDVESDIVIINCAKRSLHPRVLNQVMSVRASVRPFVRIIIDFCEEDMKGGETLLDTGSLNYGF